MTKNRLRIPNASSVTELRRAFQRIDDNADSNVTIDPIPAVGSLIVKSSDVSTLEFDALAQGTTGQALVSAGAGVVPAWGTDFGSENLTTTGTITTTTQAILDRITIFNDHVEGYDGGMVLFAANTIAINSTTITVGGAFTASGVATLGATTVDSLIIGTFTVTSPTIDDQVLISTAANAASWLTAGNDQVLGSDGSGEVTWENKSGLLVDTLDTVSDRGSTTDQTLTAGGFITTGTVTVGAAADMVITVGSITSVSGAISFGNENLVTTGTLGVGAATVTSLTDGTATLTGGSLTVVKLGSLITAGFVKTSGIDGTLSVDTSVYLTAEADTLDTVSDRGSTTDQTLTAGGFTTTGVVTVGAAADMVISVGSITSVSGAISFGNENLSTTGTLGAGATTVSSLTDGTATLIGGSLTTVKLGTLTTNGFVKTSAGDGTLSVDTSVYLTTEADTLDTVSDRGATTDQTLIAGGFTTTGVVTVGAASDMVISVGSITSVSGAISFGNENLVTTGTLGAGAATVTSITDGTATLTGGSLTAVKLGTLTTNGFVKTSASDGTLSVDTNTYLTAEADTLDTVADRGSTTDQTLTAGGFITTGTVTVGAAADMVISVGSITSVSGAISFGNENLSTTGTLGVGIATPDGTMHVHTSSVGAVSAQVWADDLVVENNSHNGITLLCRNTFSNYINFGTLADNDWAYIRADHNLGKLTFKVEASDNLIIDTAGDFSVNGGQLLVTNSTGDVSLTSGNIILSKTSGVGIKVDTAAPTFPWRDLTGAIVVKATGAGRPTFTTYKGNIEEYQFAVNDKVEFTYHIPHDYVPGSDIFLHVHWSHISTSVTGGTVTFGYELTYAKGHNQAPFGANITGTVVGTASATQYQHISSEVQISATSPSASQVDSDDLEPDGLLLVELFLNANDMTGATPDPFVHEMDIHYQSMNVGTKQNAPDFYT